MRCKDQRLLLKALNDKINKLTRTLNCETAKVGSEQNTTLISKVSIKIANANRSISVLS